MPEWPSSPDAEPPPEVFHALADPIRRGLLEHLASGPSPPRVLARRMGLPRVTVSHHLRVLSLAGLIEQQHRRAAIRAQALVRLRRYFDMALTRAAITSPHQSRVWPTRHT